jgi:hypothetical protein
MALENSTPQPGENNRGRLNIYFILAGIYAAAGIINRLTPEIFRWQQTIEHAEFLTDHPDYILPTNISWPLVFVPAVIAVIEAVRGVREYGVINDN